MKKIFSLLLLCTLCMATTSARTLRAGDKMADRDRWVKQLFLKGQLPFSFQLDGRSSDAFLSKWQRKLSAATRQADGKINYTLTLTAPKKNLQVRADIVTFADFPAVEWTLRFKNLASQSSAQISGVKAADIRVAAPKDDAFTLYTAQGCNDRDRDFHLLALPVDVDTAYRHVPTGGRSSSVSAFPFYNIAAGKGQGVFFSIGWTGTWFAEFKQPIKGQLNVAAGMENTDLYLLPGEEIRTPLVSMMFWQGEDRLDGHNLFRRFILAHHSPKIGGKTIRPPFCAGFDYGDPSPCSEYDSFTELLGAASIERLERFGLHPEVYWLDAGWYEGCNAPQSSFEGRWWWNTVGNWIPDPNRFPNGLKGLSDRIHKNGSKLMVWYEPERVYDGSRWHKEHPEWLLNREGERNHLLNLGNPEACDFLCNFMAQSLVDNGIDHYRQDFNINPASFWAAADPEGRKGITEIRYIEGLYRYWDFLLQRFPDLYIDNCASGGRRFDLETVSRAIPLWRTDCNYGEPTCQQCHTYGLSQFLPLSGTGVFYAERYCARSGMSSAYDWGGDIFSRQNKVQDMQYLFKTYYKLRHYFVGDFYPLSGDGDITGTDKWVAWQFHDTASNSGIVQAFRRDKATESEKTYLLRGVDDDATYDVYDEDTNTTVRKTGRELKAGLTVKLANPRSSALLVYSIKK